MPPDQQQRPHCEREQEEHAEHGSMRAWRQMRSYTGEQLQQRACCHGGRWGGRGDGGGPSICASPCAHSRGESMVNGGASEWSSGHSALSLSLQEPVTSRPSRHYKRNQPASKQRVTRARNHQPQPVTATNPPLSLPMRPEALCLWYKA